MVVTPPSVLMLFVTLRHTRDDTCGHIWCIITVLAKPKQESSWWWHRLRCRCCSGRAPHQRRYQFSGRECSTVTWLVFFGFSTAIRLVSFEWFESDWFLPCLLSLGFLHHYNFMQCPYVPADECCDHSACYTGIALARTIYIHVYDRILVISLPKKLYIHRIYMA